MTASPVKTPPGRAVQEQLPLDGTVETPGDPSRKQRHATEDQQRGKLEQRAEDDDLRRKATPRGIGELRQESKEE